MDFLTFLATIVGSLAWPVSLLMALLMLRRPITELLPSLRRLRYKELEVDFGKELEKIEAVMDTVEEKTQHKGELPVEVQPEPLPKTRTELLEKIANLSPNAAILESWRNVERTLDFYFSSRGIERPRSGQTILGQLDYDPNFPRQLVSAYQELRLLRNRAAHDRENLTAEHAKEFSGLADRLTFALIQAAHP
ncbi:MAG: hypothetical protein IPJ27_05345 [Candidatus Accumulibacter sp.]|uniref:DUF4145 domain-containing protein n=1 Tax=Candidatus Accumulibacter proximus TaxID=2954385 RepID=A0A935PXR5_9PROT|nr:hypothetical protein [Candidatus Accumulibacter proximus]